MTTSTPDVRPLPPGAIIEYMGDYATVVADDGGPSLIVESDGNRQEWLWVCEGVACTVSSMSKPGHAVPFMRWADIGTAPKDGTRVLLYQEAWAEDVCVGFWSNDSDEWRVAGSGSPWIGPTHWASIQERPNVEGKRP